MGPVPRWVAVILLVLTPAADAAAAAPNILMRAEVRGQRLEGRPLAVSDGQVQFLARDGRLLTFRPGEAKNYEQIGPKFKPYSASELRARLEAEYGRSFDVTSTGHYVVVHPAGEKDQWAERFEELFRSFQHYFGVRGVRLEPPPFPLVAVVLPTQEDFIRQAAREGAPVGTSVLGYYSPLSNRIMLFDITRGRPNSKDWRYNAETIIHEATHQTAFNTGIHSRFGGSPKWVVEGLGTLFEAPGVSDSRHSALQAERINRDRLEQFKRYAAGRRRPGAAAELIASDRLFASDVDAAYAESWALTFFLVETEPRKYAQYLQKTSPRPPFEDYTRAERLADFTSVFGGDLRMLEARFLRFMQDIQ
jgi:hypothetical protein